jgi:hypothetical protein
MTRDGNLYAKPTAFPTRDLHGARCAIRVEPGPAKLNASGFIFSSSNFCPSVHHTTTKDHGEHQHQVGQIRILARPL